MIFGQKRAENWSKMAKNAIFQFFRAPFNGGTNDINALQYKKMESIKSVDTFSCLEDHLT